MDGEQDGVQETGREQQGQQVDQAQPDDKQGEAQEQVATPPSDGEIRALLSEHDGDVAALKAAELWLFEAAGAQGGTTGLEPAGAACAPDKDMKRWREIAGLEDEE